MSSTFRKILVCLIAAFAFGAVAASAAMASNDEWEVSPCIKVAKETGKFTESFCETESATNKGEFNENPSGTSEKLVSPRKRHVTDSGGAFVLNAGTPTEVKCTAVTSHGTITGGKPGTDLAEEIKFTGCTTPTGCKVSNKGGTVGTIIVTNIPTKLEQRKKAGVEVLADNFEAKTVENAKKEKEKEFVTLEFSGTVEACKNYPSPTKVTGNVAAFIASGSEVLDFPTAAEGVIEGNTLKTFGVAATLSGKTTEKGLGGGKITAS